MAEIDTPKLDDYAKIERLTSAGQSAVSDKLAIG
jgi:hypothetical protein